MYTPLETALATAQTRRSNTALITAVERFLGGDIPWHFQQPSPVGYLCRHLATPNYETLRFIELGQAAGLPLIIGEDPDDRLVGKNRLKRALGKLPVTKGVTRDGKEIIEYFTIIDFSQSQGKPLRSITTTAGDPLPTFHRQLLQEIYPDRITIANESSWIDRNGRGSLTRHYERLLSLFVVHGILFEWFEPDEVSFAHAVLLPAYEFIERTFGCAPLIVELVPPSLATSRDWNAYPSILYQYISKRQSPNGQG
jgi:hypothetical protein